MRNVEKIARYILDSTFRTNTSIRFAYIAYKQQTGYEIELTDDECRRMAVNYPHSFIGIKEAFSNVN